MESTLYRPVYSESTRQCWQKERCWELQGQLIRTNGILIHAIKQDSILPRERIYLRFASMLVRWVLKKWKKNYDASYKRYRKRSEDSIKEE